MLPDKTPKIASLDVLIFDSKQPLETYEQMVRQGDLLLLFCSACDRLQFVPIDDLLEMEGFFMPLVTDECGEMRDVKDGDQILRVRLHKESVNDASAPRWDEDIPF